MITSLLDNDFSRFLLQQVAFEKFPRHEVRYRLLRRDGDRTQWTSGMIAALEEAVRHLSTLRLTGGEIAFLERQRCFTPAFLTYLRTYSAGDAIVSVKDEGGPRVEISGPMPVVALLTTPVHAICSELASGGPLDEARRRLDRKIAWLRSVDGIEDFRFNELGTRRRIGLGWQTELNERLADLQYYTGTGNALIASRLGTPLTGLMHHDFMQMFQVDAGMEGSERRALESWADSYPDRFLIALTDTLGLDSFLACFDAPLARAWTGVRHDSGDPIAWADRVIAHYAGLGIDPREKLLVFADGLRLDTAVEIHRRLRGRARLSFGIGTALTNDGGTPAPDTAVKLISCAGRPVVKASDDPAKNYGIADQQFAHQHEEEDNR
jgi:nicotinate phosphoribosyltransferase